MSNQDSNKKGGKTTINSERLQYLKCVHVFELTESESEKIKEGIKEEVLLETLDFLFVFLYCFLSPVSPNGQIKK